ncbi:MAG: hypothetical protein D6718_08690, partial [Acidobacteria bacterium]
MALAAFSPRPLPEARLEEEPQARKMAATRGRIERRDSTCGPDSGLALDEQACTVVTGRGTAESGGFRSEIDGSSGTTVDGLVSPGEPDDTLAFS